MSSLLRPEHEAFLDEAVGPEFRVGLLRAQGFNSGVYLVERAGEQWVLKLYGAKRIVTDPLRMQREVAMYRHVDQVGIECTPKLVAYDEGIQASLLSFAEGKTTLDQGAGDFWHTVAIDFLAALQTGTSATTLVGLLQGADSCQSVPDHLINVDRRIEGVDEYIFSAAGEFHHDQIVPTWHAVREWVSTHLVNKGRPTLVSQMVSPGDLGPHNSVVNQAGEIVFLDFEYGGWDDPVKFLCDLEFQPSNTFNETQIARWVQEVHSYRYETTFYERYRCMRPVHAVKWASIALNPFRDGRATCDVESPLQNPLLESLLTGRLIESDRLLSTARQAIQGME